MEGLGSDASGTFTPPKCTHPAHRSVVCSNWGFLYDDIQWGEQKASKGGARRLVNFSGLPQSTKCQSSLITHNSSWIHLRRLEPGCSGYISWTLANAGAIIDWEVSVASHRSSELYSHSTNEVFRKQLFPHPVVRWRRYQYIESWEHFDPHFLWTVKDSHKS